MKKVILLVAVVAVMFALTAFVGVVKHTSTNLVKVDNVATMTYGLEGGGYGMFKFHDHKAMNLGKMDKKSMKLRMSTKLPVLTK